jgi:hypothetical protein
VLPHPGRELVGFTNENDAEIFIWSLAWWPHAILHWTNPFFTHVVYAPTGANLTWFTTIPGLGVAFSPVTLAFGPAVAYNVAAVVLPALSAWTAYLLCSYVTRSTAASVLGGFLYGFSSYMLGHAHAGHLNLEGVFLVPLVALVVLRYLRADLDGRGLAWRLALLLAAQLSISTEVTATLTAMLLLGLVLAYALVPATRPRLPRALAPIAAGYALAGILAAPFLYYALTGSGGGRSAFTGQFGADLLNLVVPTPVTGWGGSSLTFVSSHFPGNDAERDSYLGIPVLLMIFLLAVRRFREPAVRFLLAAFVIATLLSLGTGLTVKGDRVAWLPWSIWAHWGILEELNPSRVALYATLAAAVMVSIWFATTRGLVFGRPYVLPALAVAALLPPFWKADLVEHPARVAFFTNGAYKRCISNNETLLIFPFARWGDSTLWQAESGFRFRMAEGTLGHSDQPKSFASDPTASKLLFAFLDPSTRPSMDELRAFAARRHVDRIVDVELPDNYPSEADLDTLGVVSEQDGVYVMPACGKPPLRAR